MSSVTVRLALLAMGVFAYISKEARQSPSLRDLGDQLFHRVFFIISLALVLMTGVRLVQADTRPNEAPAKGCQRIVSLAPSITEVLFELNLGTSLVGVTKFCRYPAATATVAKVGGFLDANVEVVFSLRPTVVFALRESPTVAETLKRLGVQVVTINHDTIDGIKKSVTTIAELCGATNAANFVLKDLEGREERLREKFPKNARMTAMVVVGRAREGNATSGIYISGSDGFYSDILHTLGLVNVNARQTIAVPTVSSEGIIELNPDVIIEVVNVDEDVAYGSLMQYWEQFHTVKAVKDRKVFFFTEDFASIPGPRYIQFAELLAERIHQETGTDAR